MKQIKINSILSNFENDTTNVEALADYDDKSNTISYKEEDMNVKIEIFENKIILTRKNEDYDLCMEFVENKSKRCEYIVKSIGLNVDIDIFTKILEIEENRIYINYELFNENKSIGTFEYKLIFRE